MKYLIIKCVILVILCRAISIAINCQPLEKVPGLQEPIQYTGYLNGGEDINLFYWFVESYNNPETDPVILWLNGGPGESSLWGMFLENGPFKVQNDGKTLKPNRNSWNFMANVLYLESPVGVGFSYYGKNETFKNNDNNTATMNRLAIEDFFVKYPQFRSNKFYITGEDYAGVYAPMLALEILESLPDINLKGIAISEGHYKSQLHREVNWSLTLPEIKNIMRNKGNDINSVFEHLYMKKYLDEKCMYVGDAPNPNCPLEAVKSYLNSAQTREALGIPDHVVKWQSFRPQFLMDYPFTNKSMDYTFKKIIEMKKLEQFIVIETKNYWFWEEDEEEAFTFVKGLGYPKLNESASSQSVSTQCDKFHGHLKLQYEGITYLQVSNKYTFLNNPDLGLQILKVLIGMSDLKSMYVIK